MPGKTAPVYKNMRHMRRNFCYASFQSHPTFNLIFASKTNKRTEMKRIVLSMLLALGSVAFCMAQEMQEVVYLKNGSIIRGTIIEQVPDKSLKIQTNDGSIFAYEMAEVEKITKEQATAYENNKRLTPNGNGVKRGYRGFVDLGYATGTYYNGTNRMEVLTSHGYQFNPYIYAGLGTGLHYYFGEDYGEDDFIWAVPIFANFRADFMNKKIAPFLDLKIGYIRYNDANGFYLSPTVGYRFGFNSNLALNIGVGYNLQQYHRNSDVSYLLHHASFKLGLEF